MGHGLPKIPDYRIYKWERIPDLVAVQKELARHGLKDPWIRNEVWRWHPAYGTTASRVKGFFSRGMGTGAVMAVLSWAYWKWYVGRNPAAEHWVDPSVPERHDDHGHGHGHGHGHH